MYSPGLHILAQFTAPASTLTDAGSCKRHFDQLVDTLGLANVGEVYHSFPNGGFTVTICLTESHIAMHTWPEYGLATFDVFLSNYRRDNQARVRQIYTETLSFFQGIEQTKTELLR
ncbi:S-adenosylmethionine decarboxylase [Spirosoma lacussanchae]|uniref:S-adenosylmethionine decarboxylase family protein n=1 Tax=Spirosoma lacussanchae TaxID=1884249 RepID=UPI0011091FFA|nr:S-adenosylmethionine decarboxylase [Spirosoma lacussanchae]